LDRDGDLDVLVGSLTRAAQLLVNDGTGTYTDATAARLPGADEARLRVVADVDDDGDLDLVGVEDIYLNDGSGTFFAVTAVRMPPGDENSGSIAVGDVDGDLDLDLVFGSAGANERNRLHLNDGAGFFTDGTADRLPADDTQTGAVELVDVDGDGDLDLVCGNLDQDRLYLNDGRGTFTDVTAGRMPVSGAPTNCVVAGDVDGDRDADLVLATDGPTRLYLNDGTGRFTDATPGRLAGENVRVALGDVDGDGDLDLLCANEGQDRLYLNDGTGTFTDATASHMPADSHANYSLALGDVDGDRDLDVVFGNNDTLGDRRNFLYLNDGTGTFTDVTASRMPVDAEYTQDVALGDVDGDGDLDLLTGHVGARPGANRNALFVNGGTGTFTDVTAARMPGRAFDATWAVALADVDFDGDLDMLFANPGQRNGLYINLLRQLDVPAVVGIGKPYVLEVYARGGRPSLADVAIPFVAPAGATIPLPPLGTLRLEPSTMAAFPAFLVQQPAGVGSSAVAIPYVPALVGITLHAQALLLNYPWSERLTNGTIDPITP
jgi:hypothetical protein